MGGCAGGCGWVCALCTGAGRAGRADCLLSHTELNYKSTNTDACGGYTGGWGRGAQTTLTQFTCFTGTKVQKKNRAQFHCYSDACCECHRCVCVCLCVCLFVCVCVSLSLYGLWYADMLTQTQTQICLRMLTEGGGRCKNKNCIQELAAGSSF